MSNATQDYKFTLAPDPKEPGTWSGLAAIVLGLLFGTSAPDLATPEFVGGIIAVASGVLSVFRKKKK